MTGRPKEYSHNYRFNSTMEAETYFKLKKACAINNTEMNTVFQAAAERFLLDHCEGQPLPQKEPEVPSILSNRDELLRWAHKVGPVGSRKALDNLPFLHEKLREQMRAIELSAKQKKDFQNTKS